MPDPATRHHISSAVVAAMPDREEELIARLAAMPRVEVHGYGKGRIVIVIEGSSTGEMGDRLVEIGRLDGVIAANLVFEHIEKLEVEES